MADRDTKDERKVIKQTKEALEEARDPSNSITTLSDFLNFVKANHVASGLFNKYESVIVDMWYRQPNSCPPTPAESVPRCSPDSVASDGPGDNLDDLPSLEEGADIGGVWIASPASAQFYHARYKRCKKPGSYIRDDSMRNNGLKAREDGLVVIQWDPSQSGIENNSDDKAIVHTACRVVNKEQGESRGMNVDLVLGEDCREDLEDQTFIKVARRPSRRLTYLMEEEQERPQTSMSPTGSPLSKQQPRIARLGVPIQLVVNNNYHGTTIVCRSHLDLAAALNRIPMTETKVAGSGVAETVVPKVSEGSRKKRKINEEHESRSRDRTEGPQD